MDTVEEVYLFLYYSPRSDDEGGIYLQMATSYLLFQNLQQLSPQQQRHTHILIFLNKNYPTVIYLRLKQWFKSIYTSFTGRTKIIWMKNNTRSSREWMINYIKSYEEIPFDTIVYFLSDDYLFESEMLSETIQFFTSHNPCFINQIDYPERCQLNLNADLAHFLIPKGTHLWRSISPTINSYTCRWKTFLAFEDLLMYSKTDLDFDRQVRARIGGSEIFFCAIPSYSSKLELLLLPDGVNITVNDDTEVYYKDWWSMARQALAKAQKEPSFPFAKINEQTLFA